MGGECQKMKILALGPNSTKFCIHNLWATRRLEMQKLGVGVRWWGTRVEVRVEGGVWGGGPSKRPAEGGLAASLQ